MTTATARDLAHESDMRKLRRQQAAADLDDFGPDLDDDREMQDWLDPDWSLADEQEHFYSDLGGPSECISDLEPDP